MDALDKPTYANGRLAKVGDVIIGPFYAGRIGTPTTCLVTSVRESKAVIRTAKDLYPDYDLDVVTIHHGHESKWVEATAVGFILFSDLVSAIPTIPICDEPFIPK